MRSLDVKMGWRILNRSGRWYLAAAALYDKTKPRVAIMVPIHRNLEKTGVAMEAADDALLPLCIQCSHRELLADTALRLLHTATIAADGGKPSLMNRTLFPDGLQAEIKPQSATQVQKIDTMLTQIDARGWAEQPRIAESVAGLRGARTALADALKAREDGYLVAEVARISLNKAREEFVVAYSTEIGFIRMTFPDDAAKREFFFEQADSRRQPASEPAADAPVPA